MYHYAAFHVGLHCCKGTHLGASRIQRVNMQKEPLSIRDGRKLDKPNGHACRINQAFGYMKHRHPDKSAYWKIIITETAP